MSMNMYRRILPESTPTTEVNKSASDGLLLDVTWDPGLPSILSSFFSGSLVPGITKLPLVGAFVVVNVALLMLVSTEMVAMRDSRITVSFKSS
jgi:hypothetical protein